MEHAIHFLERLRRANDEQTKLALELYNDSERVRFVLERASLPDEAERVAISIDSKDQGPLIVVTRQGKFVTCLGSGMSCDLPLIGFERLHVLLAKLIEQRGRWEMAEDLFGDTSPAKIFHTLTRRADMVSREEFQAASVLAPAIKFELASKVIDCYTCCDKIYFALKSLKRPRKRDIPSLRTYWQNLWLMSTLMPMYSIDGIRGLEEFFQIAGLDKTPWSWPLVRQNERALIFRAAWSIGRLGKPLLKGYKRRYRTAGSPLIWFDSLMGLLILGVRYPKCKAEIRKTLRNTEEFGPAVKLFIAELPKKWTNTVATILHSPDRAYEAWAEAQQKNYQEFAPLYHQPSTYCFESPADVPEDLAFTLMTNIPGGVVDDPIFCADALGFIPWLARVEADQLFMPHEFMEANRYELRPESVLETIGRRNKVYGAEEPFKRFREKLGRNDPCSCGSGRKYKQCCLGKKKA
jgi:hypothetical protein